MKGFAVLVLPWLVAGTEQFSTLRDDFCIDAAMPDCRQAVSQCQGENRRIGDCIRHEHPYCIQGASSPCSEAVAQCIDEFGKATDADADAAVKDCIVQRLISGPAAANGDGQAASDASTDPERVAACEALSRQFEEAWLADNCDGAADDSLGRRDTPEMPRPCEAASATFERAWLDNDCEAVLDAAVGNVLR